MILFLTGCAATRPQADPPQPVAQAPVEETVIPEVVDPQPVRPPSASALVESFLRSSMKPWDRTPHVFGGTAISGADCSGFIVSLYREAFGVNLPRTTRDQATAGYSVARHELTAGDLVFFRPDRVVNHVGVYLSEGRFAHISTSRGFIVSHLDEPYWNRRYAAARRVLDSYAVDSALLAWNHADPVPAQLPLGHSSHGPSVVEKPGADTAAVDKRGLESHASDEKPSTRDQAPSPSKRRGGW